MIIVILAKAVSKKGIILGLSKVFSNTLTILAILCIYTWSAAISTIKITVMIVGQIMAKTVSDQWICDSNISSTALTSTIWAMFLVYTRSAAVATIKSTMKVICVVLAVPIAYKISQLALWKNLGENRFRITNESGAFFWHFLPPLMHPAIVSGMGMARKWYLGTDNSWLNVEIAQYRFIQFKRWILAWGNPFPQPPIMASPLPSCTMACVWSPIGNFGPVN